MLEEQAVDELANVPAPGTMHNPRPLSTCAALWVIHPSRPSSRRILYRPWRVSSSENVAPWGTVRRIACLTFGPTRISALLAVTVRVSAEALPPVQTSSITTRAKRDVCWSIAYPPSGSRQCSSGLDHRIGRSGEQL